jgi:alpha-L-rhamnosidase
VCRGDFGGIRQAPGTVAWTEVLIAPNLDEITHAETSVITPRGKITSNWTLQDGRFTLKTEIPQGVSATAILPSGKRVPLNAGVHEITEP